MDENPHETIKYKQKKPIPMTPTPLEYSWWSTHPMERRVGIFILSIIVIITVAIMTVCLTQPIPTDKKCQFVVKPSIRNSVINDSLPHSIAIGDFNNDGLLDIVVPNSGMNNIGVFLRQFNGTFAEQMTYSTGSDSTPYAVAVTDFNHDQQLDIAVANFDSHSIGIFLATGNGTFRPQITFSTGPSRPQAISVADFNNDTRPDIAVANYATNNITIFLQDNNGNFVNQTTFSTGYDSNPYSLAVADFNNDHKLDISVANYGTNNVGVFLGHGNGTFDIQIIFTTGRNSHPSSIAIDDLNNDTYLDIVVACYGTNNVSVLLGYGNGTFAVPTMYSTGNNSLPRSVAIADFDFDNKLDIAVANYGNGTIVVLLGDGNGYFTLQNQTFFDSSNFNPYSIAIADFNDDNRVDIAVVNYDFNYVDIIVSYKNFSFFPQTTYTTNIYSQPASVVIVDINNDSHRDIIVANFWYNNIMIFLGYGNGTFSGEEFYSAGSGPCSGAVGDFNNDAQTDIAITYYWTYNIGVSLGNNNDSFSYPMFFSTGYDSYPLAIAVGDFNNDNRLDIAVAHSITNNVGIFLGYGNGTFATQLILSTYSVAILGSIALGDFNNDTRLDIVVSNCPWFSSIQIFLGYGDGTFFSQSIYSTGTDSGPVDVAAHDLNSDGRVDIVVALSGYHGVIVFLGSGDGTFFHQSIYSTGSQSQPYTCALGDVNNDNRPDIVVSDNLNGDIVVLLGNGDGSFSHTTSYSTGLNSGPVSIGFGHFNNDGILDIVVANINTNTIGIFLGFTYINGMREDICSTGSSPHPRAVALGDFNKDTRLDIVMTNYGLDNVDVLLQDTNKTFSLQRIFSTGVRSLPTSVAVGDFNNDTKLDMTIANSGTANIGVFYGYDNGNFTSQTTLLSELNLIPQSVAVGDFNNDQRLDIVVADSGTESVITLLRYDPGAFGNQTAYSTGINSNPVPVAVADLNNDGWLDFVVANQGNDNVGIFLGLGNGIFSNQTTYSTGDYSRPGCIAIADLNRDNYLDIIVGNHLNETMGIFLGFGDGTFSDQTIFSTGSYSYPSAIAISDLNNDRRLDIIVANYYTDSIRIFLGYDNGTFSNITDYYTGSQSWPCSVAVGDLNNDNQLDIIVANYLSDNLGVFLGYGDGTFSVMISQETTIGSEPLSVVVADFNNDNQLDVLVAYSGENNIGVIFGSGNGHFSNPTRYSTGDVSYPRSPPIGDFNNDHQLDIAIVNYGTDSFGVFLGHGNGTFFSQQNYFIAFSSSPSSIAIGDFNNDNRLDIVVTGTDTSTGTLFGTGTAIDYVYVYFGYVSETIFVLSYSIGSLSQVTSIAVGDFDDDTRLDVVVANNGTGNVMVLFGSGYGTFISQRVYSTGDDSHPCWVAVGDLNNDNRLDIAVANSGTHTVGIFLNNGTGTFSSQMTYSTGVGSRPHSVAILDFNNDTRLDVAVANYGSGSVIVLFGDGNGSFTMTDESTFNTGFESRPYGIAVGDVNNDKLSDIVVTNNGYGNVDIILKEC